uniref:Uncharacterized protein n=1 Tax=CrAss-like virus sp. ctXt06 TaxID=2825837 RepID=A0A8S5V6W2_9CAUD|nr:MAG TPA: hypothetical protein [CrAss-like virus sp. ctXt06]
MLRERLSHACLYLRNKLNLNALHENLKYYIYLKCPGIQISTCIEVSKFVTF